MRPSIIALGASRGAHFARPLLVGAQGSVPVDVSVGQAFAAGRPSIGHQLPARPVRPARRRRGARKAPSVHRLAVVWGRPGVRGRRRQPRLTTETFRPRAGQEGRLWPSSR